MKNRIVAVVGMCGAGKTEVVNYFVQNEYKRVYFGDVTFDEMNKRGLAITSENERIVREEFRASGDMGIYAKLNEPKVSALYKSGENVVIESMYSWSEYKYLKEIFGDDFYVVCVVANRQVREARLKTRKIRPLTEEEVKIRDYAEIENIEKGGPIGIADYYILNNFSIEELKQKTLEMIWYLDSID